MRADPQLPALPSWHRAILPVSFLPLSLPATLARSPIPVRWRPPSVVSPPSPRSVSFPRLLLGFPLTPSPRSLLPAAAPPFLPDAFLPSRLFPPSFFFHSAPRPLSGAPARWVIPSLALCHVPSFSPPFIPRPSGSSVLPVFLNSPLPFYPFSFAPILFLFLSIFFPSFDPFFLSPHFPSSLHPFVFGFFFLSSIFIMFFFLSLTFPFTFFLLSIFFPFPFSFIHSSRVFVCFLPAPRCPRTRPRHTPGSPSG